MIKRMFVLTLLLVIAISAVGLAPTTATGAPSLAVKDAPNAALLPADTALYADFKVGDLNKTLDFVGGIYEKVTGEKMPGVFADVNRSLTQGLGRDASFEKDIQPWLGDHITAAMRVTDKQISAFDDALKNPSNKLSNVQFEPQFVVIISVKNDAVASKFLTELFDKAKQSNPTMAMSTRTDMVNGSAATIYDQGGMCEMTCGSVVVGKGFIMAGQTLVLNDVMAGYKAKSPALAADKNFAKMLGALKPNNLATVYINPRLYSYFFAVSMMRQSVMTSAMAGTPDANQTATPMPDPTAMLRSALSAIQGQAFGLRLDGKVIAIDLAEGVDLKAMSDLYTKMGFPGDFAQKLNIQPISYKIAKQIPATALAVATSHGLGNLYTSLRDGIKAAASNPDMQGQFGRGPDFSQMNQGFTQIETALKAAFDIDITTDVVPWMNGEFATYMNFNQNSELAKLGRQPWPFDHVLLIESSDTAKTKAFIGKLNAGLTKNGVTPTSSGDNLYKVDTKKGLTIGYGLVGSTFVLSTGSGLDTAVAAIKGDGIISANAVWKNAQAKAISPASQFLFVNLNQLQSMIKAFVPTSELTQPDTIKFLKLLDQFESFTISSGVIGKDGMITANAVLSMK